MEQIIKKVVRVGNSAGVILPKQWLEGTARIELVKKPLDIKSDVLSILSPYLANLLAVYLVGSYARGEQDSKSDVDIFAISQDIKKEIKEGKYNISIYPIESLRKTVKVQPELFLPRMAEAKVILNSSLLEEFKNKFNKNSFKKFYEDSKRMLKVSKEFVRLDKKSGKELESHSVIYSLILRLRGLLLIKNLISGEKYSRKAFEKFILSYLDKEEFEKCYEIYRLEKEGKSSKKIRVEIETARKLIKFFEKELEYLK